MNQYKPPVVPIKSGNAKRLSLDDGPLEMDRNIGSRRMSTSTPRRRVMNMQTEFVVGSSETEGLECCDKTYTKEEVEMLLKDRFKGRKFDSKGKQEWMIEYIKRMKTCVKSFQKALEDVVEEKDGLRKMLDSSESKCLETETALKSKVEEFKGALDCLMKEKESRMALETNRDSLRKELGWAEQNVLNANKKAKMQEHMYARLQECNTQLQDELTEANHANKQVESEKAEILQELSTLRALNTLLQREFNAAESGKKMVQEAALTAVASVDGSSQEGFFPRIDQVAPVLVPLLKFYFHKEVRKAAVSAMPDLLRSSKLAIEKGLAQGRDGTCLKELSDYIVPALVEALHKEPDTETIASMLNALSECLQISGPLVDENQVRSTVDEIKHVITASSSRKGERAERTKAEDFDAELLKEENEQEEEVFKQRYLVSVKQDYHNMNAQLPSLDKISNLPSSIIEKILCLVPIKEAARTSILSKEWRYKWIKIPKLVFNGNVFEMSTYDSQQSEKMNRCKLFYAIYQVLFVHQGPILDFTLVMDADETCYEIDQIINHLSRMNTVKRFKLYLNESENYKLPLSIFSLHQLTHLYLEKLDIHHQPPFNGYGNLTKLYLSDVTMPAKTLLHLLSSCPLLKTLTLLFNEEDILGDKCTFIELFKCLSVLENLTTWTWLIECFDLGPVPRELPASLVNLKYLCVEEMCLFNDLGLPFLILLIKSSPNLVKLVLEIHEDSATYPVIQKFYEKNRVTLDKYSDIWLGHLNELELDGFFNLKLLLDFVKFILSRSPMLKKVSIWLHELVTKDEESNIWKVLLSSPHASPVVDFTVERYD